MLYKTMVLELLQQRPEIHNQLRKERKLLLTMEQYASLCVELSLDPVEVVLARFRIDAAGRAALDALWARRLAMAFA